MPDRLQELITDGEDIEGARQQVTRLSNQLRERQTAIGKAYAKRAPELQPKDDLMVNIPVVMFDVPLEFVSVAGGSEVSDAEKRAVRDVLKSSTFRKPRNQKAFDVQVGDRRYKVKGQVVEHSVSNHLENGDVAVVVDSSFFADAESTMDPDPLGLLQAEEEDQEEIVMQSSDEMSDEDSEFKDSSLGEQERRDLGEILTVPRVAKRPSRFAEQKFKHERGYGESVQEGQDEAEDDQIRSSDEEFVVPDDNEVMSDENYGE